MLAKLEVIFIDDGSQDNSVEILKELNSKDKSVKLLSFTRNLGVNQVFRAGLDIFSGDCFIFLDADNQYPISVIEDLINSWENGNEITFARRINYEPGIIFSVLSFFFIKFINLFSIVNLDQNTSYVCSLDKKVVSVLKEMNESSKYYPALIRWTGFAISHVDCVVNKRTRGVSKIRFRKKASEAINAITDFTAAPLRLWTYIGLIVSLTSMLYGFYVLVNSFLYGIKVPGYLSIFLSVVFMGGLQLISLGVLSEYITKIYNEGKKRPDYVVKEKIGL